MQDRLRTGYIRTYDNPFEAHIARCKLANSGIQSFVTEQNVFMVIPYFGTNFNMGLRLHIDKDDKQKALELLDDYFDDKEMDCCWYIKCPNCDSSKVKLVYPPKENKLMTIVATLLFDVNISIKLQDSFQCLECKKKFKISEANEE